MFCEFQRFFLGFFQRGSGNLAVNKMYVFPILMATKMVNIFSFAPISGKWFLLIATALSIKCHSKNSTIVDIKAHNKRNALPRINRFLIFSATFSKSQQMKFLFSTRCSLPVTTLCYFLCYRDFTINFSNIL